MKAKVWHGGAYYGFVYLDASVRGNGGVSRYVTSGRPFTCLVNKQKNAVQNLFVNMIPSTKLCDFPRYHSPSIWRCVGIRHRVDRINNDVYFKKKERLQGGKRKRNERKTSLLAKF